MMYRIISSQLLIKYERRMTTSIYSLNKSLAHHINSKWTIQPHIHVENSLDTWKRSLQGILYLFHEVVAREGIGFIVSGVGRKSDPTDALMEILRPQLLTYSSERASLLEFYLRTRITEELISGKDSDVIRKNIIKLLSNRHYAIRIARSEVHTALERGAWEAINSLGLASIKRWVSREDVKVRPAHSIAHNQIKSIREPFIVGGERLMYPGDPSASARNNANCRCTVSYEVG